MNRYLNKGKLIKIQTLIAIAAQSILSQELLDHWRLDSQGKGVVKAISIIR